MELTTQLHLGLTEKKNFELCIHFPVRPHGVTLKQGDAGNVFSIYLSICLSIYLSIYDCTALADFGRFFSFLMYTQSVGLLGRGISPSQGRYLHTEQHRHRINAHRHP
jgi:hypothetical protein